MKLNKESLGLDIGTGAIKLIHLKRCKNGIKLVKAIVAELDQYPIEHGEDEDSHVVRIIKGLIKTHNIRMRKVIPVIPRYATLINNIKLPPVHESRICQLMEYEAKQHNPFVNEETSIAWHCLNGSASSEERDVLLVIARNKRLEREINIAKRLKLQVHTVDINSFALYNLHRFCEESTEDVICHIDIGAKRTDLVIHGGDSPIFSRYISIAGDHITKAIAERFGINFKEAEILKKKRGIILIQPEEPQWTEEEIRISNAIKPVLEKLIDEIHKSISYYYQSRTAQKDISRYILSGGSRRLRNLETYLESNLGKKIEPTNPFRNIHTDGMTFHEDQANYLSIATGLALRGLGYGDIKINLLTTELKKKRQRYRSLRYLIPAFIIAMLMPILYMPGIRQELATRKSQLNEINLNLTRHKEFMTRLPEIERLKNENSHLETNLTQLKGIVSSSIIKLEAIFELNRITPANTTLANLSIDTQNKIVLDGTTDSYKEIEGFIQSLEASSYFKEAKLIEADTDKASKSQDHINFKIGLILK
jgi:type IV pilus assembly protein PilM